MRPMDFPLAHACEDDEVIIAATFAKSGFSIRKILSEIFMISTWRRNGRALMAGQMRTVTCYREQMTKPVVSVSVTVVCCVSPVTTILSDSLDVGRWQHCNNQATNLLTKICAGPGPGVPLCHKEVRCQRGLEARRCQHDANTLSTSHLTWGSNDDISTILNFKAFKIPWLLYLFSTL